MKKDTVSDTHKIHIEGKIDGIPRMVMNDEFIYMAYAGLLYQYERKMEKWLPISWIPDEYIQGIAHRENLGFNLGISGRRLVMTSEWSDSFFVIDTENLSGKEFRGNSRINHLRNCRHFQILDNDREYLIPCAQDEAAILDYTTWDIAVVRGWKEEICRELHSKSIQVRSITTGCVCRDADLLYFDLYAESQDVIAVLEKDNLALRELIIPETKGYYWCMECDGDHLWVQKVYEGRNSLVSLERKTGRIEREYDLHDTYGYFTVMSQSEDAVAIFGANGRYTILKKGNGDKKTFLLDDEVPICINSFPQNGDAAFWNGEKIHLIHCDTQEERWIEAPRKSQLEVFIDRTAVSQ